MDEGRALDAMIAEKVMGIDPEKWRYRCYVEHHERDEAWCYDCCALVGDAPADQRVPDPYSTDMAAAWPVASKRLPALGFFLTLHSDWHGNWTAELCKQGVGRVYETPWTTGPHAICLAALRALNAENPESTHV